MAAGGDRGPRCRPWSSQDRAGPSIAAAVRSTGGRRPACGLHGSNTIRGLAPQSSPLGLPGKPQLRLLGPPDFVTLTSVLPVARWYAQVHIRCTTNRRMDRWDRHQEVPSERSLDSRQWGLIPEIDARVAVLSRRESGIHIEPIQRSDACHASLERAGDTASRVKVIPDVGRTLTPFTTEGRAAERGGPSPRYLDLIDDWSVVSTQRSATGVRGRTRGMGDRRGDPAPSGGSQTLSHRRIVPVAPATSAEEPSGKGRSEEHRGRTAGLKEGQHHLGAVPRPGHQQRPVGRSMGRPFRQEPCRRDSANGREEDADRSETQNRLPTRDPTDDPQHHDAAGADDGSREHPACTIGHYHLHERRADIQACIVSPFRNSVEGPRPLSPVAFGELDNGRRRDNRKEALASRLDGRKDST